MKVGSLKEFLAQYGDVLTQSVASVQSVYNPESEGDWEQQMRQRLNKLLRAPFAKQAEAILALTKGFKIKNKRGLFLTAEMGTGKTYMALATSFLSCRDKSRTLILCPGHLVQKWIREIRETIEGAQVVNLNRPGLEKLMALRGTKPACREFYVIGKEQAKLHYCWEANPERFGESLHSVPLNACPKCGYEVVEGFARHTKKPVCETCGEPVWQANGRKFRRYSKAEYVKRFFPRGFFDLFVADEVHQYKAGDTAQGQAFAIFCNAARHTLCLTGTLMGGYSSGLFYLLWRTNPRLMKEVAGGYSGIKTFCEKYGVLEEVIKTPKSDKVASIARGVRKTVKEKPGINPQLFTDCLLEHSVFMRLDDLNASLPPFQEYVETVEMDEDVAEEYRSFRDTLVQEVRQALARGNRKLLGAMLQSLLAYPDGARRGEVVTHPDDGAIVAEAAAIEAPLLPKEKRLLEIVEKEKQLGRKVLVCLEHTGTRDLIPDLVERLASSGITSVALRSATTTTEKREEWVRKKISKSNPDVLITNPRLIETGLDLLDFPTIVFFQTGYSTFTLRQASRRSWRIGQTEPVRVVYLAYKDTLQETALQLMGEKMQVALLVEGELSDRGLAALAEGESSMLVKMAKSLLGEEDGATTHTLEEVWESYQRTAQKATARLDEANVGYKPDANRETPTPSSQDKKPTQKPLPVAVQGGSPEPALNHVLLGALKKVRGKLQAKVGGQVLFLKGNSIYDSQGTVVGAVRPAWNRTMRWVGDLFGKAIEIRSDGNRSLLIFACQEEAAETEQIEQSAA